jgi:hypothetical protein
MQHFTRQDLLNLTIDDLITLSNRGLVKRAQQESTAPDLVGTIQEDEAGNVQVDWSDEIRCVLPAATTLSQSQCSCPATSLCRHLLRSVLLYQSKSNSMDNNKGPELESPSDAEWNPGTIADETLSEYYSKSELAKLRSQFDLGQVIRVSCGIKPTAHLHSCALNLRFLVPHDLRYTHCDCDEVAPCRHVPLAIWAFRQLASDQTQALITTETETIAPPIDLLDDLDLHLRELATVGIVGMTQPLRDRFSRLEGRCRSTDLVWIAEILLDLQQACDHYQQHDAQFDGEQVLQYISELWIRSDALRNHALVKNPVPQLFIRGSSQDQTVAIGSARLVGLGCGITVRSSGVTLTAYLQDVDSGTLVALPKSFANPAADQLPDPFYQLAHHSVGKRMQLGAIGAGQILMKGGKRSPSGHLIPGRGPMSLNPQSYQWEKLRSPLRIDSFTELTHHLQQLPPPQLRPRRITEQLQVLSIAEVRSVEFDASTQTVRSIVADSCGMTATLIHPYFHRGRFGVERLLTQLQQSELKFVSAQVAMSNRGLILSPIALVFQSGDSRSILQPWISDPHSNPNIPQVSNTPLTPSPQNALTAYRQDLSLVLQDLWLVGLDRADTHHLQQCQRLVQQGRAIGFHQLLVPIIQLTDALAQKFQTLQWEAHVAQECLAIVTVLNGIWDLVIDPIRKGDL